MRYVTNFGELDSTLMSLPADLLPEEVEKIAKAMWDAVHDVFDARMAAIPKVLANV